MEENISYKHKRSKRAKRMRLAVYCDGSVVITSPAGVKQSIIEKFFADKKQWVLDKIRFFKSINGGAVMASTRKDYLKNKDKAFDLARDRVGFYNNNIYNFSFNKITIRNQKTRWGSCSKKGNINFNYKIALLPLHLADYIIVHELCHLGEFNHSQKFWNLVSKATPNHPEIRKELKKIRIGIY